MNNYFDNNICCRDIKKIKKINTHINTFWIDTINFKNNRDLLQLKLMNYKININSSTKTRRYVYNYTKNLLYFLHYTTNRLIMFDFITKININLNNF